MNTDKMLKTIFDILNSLKLWGPEQNVDIKLCDGWGLSIKISHSEEDESIKGYEVNYVTPEGKVWKYTLHDDECPLHSHEKWAQATAEYFIESIENWEDQRRA